MTSLFALPRLPELSSTATPDEATGAAVMLASVSTDEATMAVEQLEVFTMTIEQICSVPQMRLKNNRAQLQIILEYVKIAFHTASLYEKIVNDRVPEIVRSHLEDIVDRLDELTDTLAWGAEQSDELSSLIGDELCVSLRSPRHALAVCTNVNWLRSKRSTPRLEKTFRRPSIRTSACQGSHFQVRQTRP